MPTKRYVTLVAGVAILIVIFATIYGTVQQAQRNDANYPQIQMAEDTAAQIQADKDPHLASTLTPVNMDSSLAPFTIVYDSQGNVLAGSGYLGGKVPKAPIGLLQDSRGKTYHAQTWQPKDGVRIAAVTVTANVSSKQYYVLSGRSLTEVEKNENHTFWLSFAGGVLSVVILAGAVVVKTAYRPAPGRQ